LLEGSGGRNWLGVIDQVVFVARFGETPGV